MLDGNRGAPGQLENDPTPRFQSAQSYDERRNVDISNQSTLNGPNQ